MQRDTVEYWVLRWKQMLLSTRRVVGDGCCRVLGALLTADARRAGGRAEGGRRAGRDFHATPKDSLLQRDSVEYSVLRWRRMQLSTACCVGDGCCRVLGALLTADARRAGGQRAGRDFNTTPKGSLLQRDAVEYWVLRWRRMQLSAGCCVGDGCC